MDHFIVVSDAVTTASSGDTSRVLIVLLLTVTLVVAAKSLRLIWGPMSELVGLLLRTGAVAVLAVVMLLLVVALSIGLV
ncbi:MAG TPA: hypothetical protein VE172_05665 [Stackebrandtia sp.]|jgi:uncharacterized membrane protein|uniref:hypothetical protein n=1 Tax=Stackebrandtia sp. TaxID=2023065 RepID=UPI002D3726AF|nr:hypothetical protein [Stackebrandtia sp.]HZE38282.1 hypothetical protein [Stackebrandtia sp.]